MRYLVLVLASILLPCISCDTTTEPKSNVDLNVSEEEDELIKSLIGWVRDNNGIVNAKLGVHRKDENSPLKFYAKKNILDRETLLTIPATCSIISSHHAYAPQGMVILPRVGDYVNVNRDSAGQWHLATVTFVDKPRSRVNVKYDDGTEEFLVDFDAIQLNGGHRRRGDVLCSTANNITTEINLGAESKFSPLINYAKQVLKSNEEMNIQPNLPVNAWSDEGKELLWKVFQIEQGLPSYYNTSDIFDDNPMWQQRDCSSVSNDTSMGLAFEIQNHFGYNADILFPFFDLLSHRNGKVMNARMSIQGGSNEVIVRSTRAIGVGEDLVVSHYECAECSTDVVKQTFRSNYGTMNILVDYVSISVTL